MATTPTSTESTSPWTISSGGGGTYSWELAMSLLFIEEMTKYAQYHTGAGYLYYYDMGVITEVLGKQKYKVKLKGLGSVVTARAIYDNSPTGKPIYLKGAVALVICEKENTVFTILSVRQTGAYTPTPEEVPV